MSGWVCSYRKIWDHPIFAGNAKRVGVWQWMLHTAAWKERPFKTGGEFITLKRGQLCVSQRQIADETGVGRQEIRTLLRELELTHAITQTATQGRTVITICNYAKYQDREEGSNPAKNQTATQEQPTKEQGITNITTSSNEEDAASPPSEPVEVNILSTAVWNAGKPFLASRGVKNPGGVIGRWLKAYPPMQLLGAIEAAQKAGTQDPIPYITQILSGGASSDGRLSREEMRKAIANAQ